MAVIIVLIAVFFVFDFSHYLSVEFLKSRRAAIDAYYQNNPMGTTILFFLTCVVVTGLSLPGAALMSLAAGAIFGLLLGTAIVSFACATGATIAFLASRFILHDMLQARFGSRLKVVNAGTRLAQLENISGILSPGLIASFALMGTFPLIAR